MQMESTAFSNNDDEGGEEEEEGGLEALVIPDNLWQEVGGGSWRGPKVSPTSLTCTYVGFKYSM